MPNIKPEKSLYEQALYNVNWWTRAALESDTYSQNKKKWLDDAAKWAAIAIALKPEK